MLDLVLIVGSVLFACLLVLYRYQNEDKPASADHSYIIWKDYHDSNTQQPSSREDNPAEKPENPEVKQPPQILANDRNEKNEITSPLPAILNFDE